MTNRHLIPTRSSVTIETPGDYELVWDLLDETDAVAASGTLSMGTISTVPDTRLWEGQIEPSSAAPLAAGMEYKVRARLFRVVSGAPVVVHGRLAADTRKFVHFTGTDSADAALNVVTLVESVTVNRNWLLETDYPKRKLDVAAVCKIYRYDAWDAAPADDDVALTVMPEIIKSAGGASHPLTADGNMATVSFPSHDLSGGMKVPAEGTVNFTAIGLDPLGVVAPQLARVMCRVQHVEDPAAPATRVSARTKSDEFTLLHFTGKVVFDTVEATVTSFAGDAGMVPTTLPASGGVYAQFTPAAGAGTIDGVAGYTFGDGSTPLVADLQPDGTAVVSASITVPPFIFHSGPLALTPGSPAAQIGDAAGIVFVRKDDILLSHEGVHGSVTALLPAGAGWTDDKRSGLLSDEVSFGTVALGQDLTPLSDPVLIPAPGTFFLCEETKPLHLEPASLTWAVAAGEFQCGATAQAHPVRKPLLLFLASYSASYPDAEMAFKRSNDHLYTGVYSAQNASVKRGESNGAELTANLGSNVNSFVTHFPYDVEVEWTATLSGIPVVGDRIAPAGGALNGAQPLELPYNRHCQAALEMGCGSADVEGITLTPGAGAYALTADGGLHVTGTVTMDLLRWGTIPPSVFTHGFPRYAHRVATAFSEGGFLMAGTFLRGDQNPGLVENGPATLLLSGFDPAALDGAERPGTTDYNDGLADYAGMNFRCEAGGFDGASTLQGDAYGPYPLTTRSKYYARQSGVTGIHEAEAGGFPGTAVIGDYQFTLSSYGFSFLSNEQEDSRTNGELSLPAPVNFELEFTELRLSCLGALEGFTITGAGVEDSKEFDAWDAVFTPFTAAFESTSTCHPGAGTTLVLGFSAHASHFVGVPFAGALGILPTGDFVTAAQVAAGAVAETVPSRLTLPSVLTLTGPGDKEFSFLPAQGAYLNDMTGASEGYWSLFGSLDVPFFRDAQAHLHTRCARDDASSVMHVMGGWPDHGWVEGGLSPFSKDEFDADHKGHTGTLAGYRDSGGEDYRPRAQQEWLGVIDFDYPLVWSTTTFSFAAQSATTNNLVVLETENELLFLDGENAHISFGARYDGLPEINLTNMVFNAVDEATGVSAALVNAVGDKVFSGLSNGVEQLSAMLSDKADDLLGPALEALANPVLDAFLDGVEADISAHLSAGTDWRGSAQARVDAAFKTTAPDSMRTALEKIGNSVADAESFLAKLEDALVLAEWAADSMCGTLKHEPGEVDPSEAVELAAEFWYDGVLKATEDEGVVKRWALRLLATEMLDMLTDALTTPEAKAAVNALLDDLLEEAEPALNSVCQSMDKVRELLEQIRQHVRTGQNLAQEIGSLVNDAKSLGILASMSEEVAVEMEARLAAATDLDLAAHLPSLKLEWRSALLQKLKDAIYATDLVADIQEAVKERVYDLEASFREAVDTAFATLNSAIREAMSNVLATLDTKIHDTLGDFGDKLGSGSITGFAHINGDSLDLLRLDGRFKLGVPDDLELAGYLQIRELDSDGPQTCFGKSGEKTCEIMIGVDNASLAWAGLSAEGARADMSAKFGIQGGTPVSMGGSFEMTEGELGYETFEIYELAAAVMFGSTENYIAAGVGMRFDTVSLAGGIFLGRSCTLEPLELIDPLVAQVITSGSITGIYAYGEVSMPIFGGTCAFTIGAKVGAGLFYFQEGPTYGGRMTLGAYGKGLCAVSIAGDLSLVGAKSGNTYSYAGRGTISGQAGKCKLCVKARFQVDVSYTKASGWKVKY